MNATIVVETLHYLVKHLGSLEGPKRGRIFLSYEMPFYSIDEETADLTVTKLGQFTHLGIGGRDPTVLATISVECITSLMTHDQAFKRIPDLDVVDPV